jgi:hypothetical protein
MVEQFRNRLARERNRSIQYLRDVANWRGTQGKISKAKRAQSRLNMRKELFVTDLSMCSVPYRTSKRILGTRISPVGLFSSRVSSIPSTV